MNRLTRRMMGLRERVTEPDAHPVNLRTRRRNPRHMKRLSAEAREAERATPAWKRRNHSFDALEWIAGR